MHHIHSKNFKSFQEWNIECINKLSDQDAEFIKKICILILQNKLVMNHGACTWIADGIYFNKESKLIIKHPR